MSDLDFDLVFLRSFSITATVGPETWHRLNRPQPVILDIRMRTSIALAGDTDSVINTIHYGTLCKAITEGIESTKAFRDLKHFAQEVCKTALGPGGGGKVVELTVTLPKGLLLAEGVGISTVQVKEGDDKDNNVQLMTQSQSLFVRDLKLACIIGVNPHERLEKQYVVINLTFLQVEEVLFTGYAEIVKKISDSVEVSSYETLEALATFIGRVACSGGSVGTVTVSVQKPSALTFVAGSGVEITRHKDFYLKGK